LSVELLVIGQESLVVAPVTGFRRTVDGDHQAGADVGATANTAGYLDVLRRGFGLPDDGHQAEAVDVNPDFNDV